MTPEETFEKLLGLGLSWKVIRTDYEVERNTFVICVKETEALWPEESAKCGQTVSCYDHVEAAQAQADWAEVVWVGADEMNRKKGHNYITVFADLVNKRVLFGTEGKDASVWERFAQQFAAHNGHPKAVTQVAIDMSRAFIKGARENFGNAQLVFDKFHVIQEANDGVERVRRLETQQDELKGRQLAKSQWIFRKNPESHTERELERIGQMDW